MNRGESRNVAQHSQSSTPLTACNINQTEKRLITLKSTPGEEGTPVITGDCVHSQLGVVSAAQRATTPIVIRKAPNRNWRDCVPPVGSIFCEGDVRKVNVLSVTRGKGSDGWLLCTK